MRDAVLLRKHRRAGPAAADAGDGRDDVPEEGLDPLG
jgi:hypothetical protein